MENYRYYQGMELVINKLSDLLKDKAVGSIADRALLLSYQAAYEKKPDKAIKMQKDAIAMIPKMTSENALLLSNLYANLGGMYKMNGKLELAKENMEQAIRIIDEVWPITMIALCRLQTMLYCLRIWDSLMLVCLLCESSAV